MPFPSCNIDDIEDLIKPQSLKPNDTYILRKYILPRNQLTSIKNKSQKQDDDVHNQENDDVQFFNESAQVPEKQSVWVRTWGCAHNNSDSEYMAGMLASYGYNIVSNKHEANVWLLNSCTVKGPAEDHFRNAIKEGSDLGKYVILAGCVSQAAPKQKYLNGLSIIGVQQIDRVVEVVEETLKGHTVRLLGQKKQQGKKSGGAQLSLPKIRKNPLIEILAISTGCLNQCTYCKTKHARGELGSYPIEQLVQRAEEAFAEGVCEIWLTSEDTGAYGRDIGVSLPELLWRIVEVIPEGAMMRVGMTNPPYILEHLDEMARLLNHPRVYAFLHLPVQSGSDSVLMDMKREYCRADFKHVVDFLREKVSGLTIATDIICGFPTETNEDFFETMTLVEEYKFPSLFINQFYPRPGTPAAKMWRVPTQEVKRRTKAAYELFQSYKPYEHEVGQIQRILVTEISFDKKHYVGHNKFYEQVIIPIDEELMGKMVEVEIISAGKYSMEAKVLHEFGTPSLCKPAGLGQVSGVQSDIAVTSNRKVCDQQTEQNLSQVNLNPFTRTSLLVAFLVLVAALLVRIYIKLTQ